MILCTHILTELANTDFMLFCLVNFISRMNGIDRFCAMNIVYVDIG